MVDGKVYWRPFPQFLNPASRDFDSRTCGDELEEMDLRIRGFSVAGYPIRPSHGWTPVAILIDAERELDTHGTQGRNLRAPPQQRKLNARYVQVIRQEVGARHAQAKVATLRRSGKRWCPPVSGQRSLFRFHGADSIDLRNPELHGIGDRHLVLLNRFSHENQVVLGSRRDGHAHNHRIRSRGFDACGNHDLWESRVDGAIHGKQVSVSLDVPRRSCRTYGNAVHDVCLSEAELSRRSGFPEIFPVPCDLVPRQRIDRCRRDRLRRGPLPYRKRNDSTTGEAGDAGRAECEVEFRYRGHRELIRHATAFPNVGNPEVETNDLGAAPSSSGTHLRSLPFLARGKVLQRRVSPSPRCKRSRSRLLLPQAWRPSHTARSREETVSASYSQERRCTPRSRAATAKARTGSVGPVHRTSGP